MPRNLLFLLFIELFSKSNIQNHFESSLEAFIFALGKKNRFDFFFLFLVLGNSIILKEMSNKCHCKNWACHSPNSSENKTIMITFTTVTTDLKEKNGYRKNCKSYSQIHSWIPRNVIPFLTKKNISMYNTYIFFLLKEQKSVMWFFSLDTQAKSISRICNFFFQIND